MSKRIILGTVQLGTSYGINNSKGKPDQQHAHQILQAAQECGIELVDSAEAYGDSLNVIGSFMKSAKSELKVISKFIGGQEQLESKVDKTLEDINCKSLYAYLYHRFNDYSSENYKKQTLQLKEKGKVERIGVSLYRLDELKKVADDTTIDLIQIPLNVFDLDDQKIDLLEEAKRKGKEIHVRSVFLQGLFFMDPHSLTGNLLGLKQPLQHLRNLIRNYGIGARTVCLNFALAQPFVDRVIIGVDDKEQLIENLESVHSDFPKELIKELREIHIPDRSLLNPSIWRL